MLANVGYTMQKCLPMSKLKFKRVSPVLYKITKENSQIQRAFEAQRIIKNIFMRYKESLKKEEYDEAIKLLNG
jgi:hypothetical protein